MHRERFPDRATHRQRSTASPGVPQVEPGKRTLTEDLAMPRCEPGAPAAELTARGTAASPSAAPPAPATGSGPQRGLQMLFGFRPAATAAAGDPAQAQGAAARGIATPSAPLPFADTIQRSFGRHDISSVKAHAGAEAAASAGEMGAQAYATGDHVVLGKGMDLFTVAHEAAHVVQQRHGVHLKGGVGEDEDAYEQHANAVAEAVVSGQSAEELLDSGAHGAAASAPEVEDDEEDGARPDVSDEVLADDGWTELAPALDEALDEVPGADQVDRAQLERRVGHGREPSPAELERLDLKPLIARGVELLGGGPSREVDEAPAAAATSGAIQMDRGRRDKGTLTSSKAQHRYQQGQRKQQARKPKQKGSRALRREEERRARKSARNRRAAKVNWTGVLLLMLVLGASAIETSHAISRGRPPQRGPEPKDPGPSTPPGDKGGTTGQTSDSTASSLTVPSGSVKVGGGSSGDLARLPTSEIASRLNTSNPGLFKLVSRRWNGTVFDVESGFKIKSNVETASLKPFLDRCKDDECRALVKAYYLKTGIDNTVNQIWSDGHEIAFIGENHEDESSQLIKTHLACGFTPGQRYLHFEEGITRNLQQEQHSVEQRCQTTDGPSTPQRVVRGVESELQLSLAAAASAHDEFANGRASLDTRDPGMVRAVLLNDVMKPHLVGLLGSLSKGAGGLVQTLLHGDPPSTYVQKDWVELTGAMTKVLVKDAEAAKMDVGVVKSFLDNPTDRARTKQLTDEVILGARNAQWAEVIDGSMKEFEGVKAVVVLGDNHATGLAKLLGKSLPKADVLGVGETPVPSKAEGASGEKEKPSGGSVRPVKDEL